MGFNSRTDAVLLLVGMCLMTAIAQEESLEPPPLIINRQVPDTAQGAATNQSTVRRFWSSKQVNDTTNYQTGLEHHIIPIDAVAEVPEPVCQFKILRGGLDGERVFKTGLNDELYYHISCQPQQENLKDSYCLTVFNCTVKSAFSAGNGYTIIDDNGCSLEPGLFEHVEYAGDLTAGIRNPYPIGFRGGSSTVRFKCVTRLLIKAKDGKCVRHRCVGNEYVRGYGGNARE